VKITKVSRHIRYVAFLSPVNHRYYVKREIHTVSGQWMASPSVVWPCENQDAANRLCDKQAALERHLRKELAGCT